MAPEVKRWITVKGVHIPVFDGESVEDAIKHRFKNLKPNNKTNNDVKESEGRNPEPDFHSAEEAYKYYQKKFSECSSTYRNKVATRLNIGGRGQEKINALARAMADRWKTSHNVVSDQDQKERQIEANKKQAEIASNATPQEEKPFTDPLTGALGKREKVEDVVEKLNDLRLVNAINPHYGDSIQPKGKNYHNNCALCTAATVFQTMGYDVEAGLQPKVGRYDLHDIMKIDTSNPDNYLLASNKSGTFGMQNVIEGAINKEVKVQYDKTHKEVIYPMGVSISSPEWQAYREYRDGLQDEINKAIKQRSVPKGANAVGKAICDKITKWGKGGVGEISVSWAKATSSHSMVAYYDGTEPVIYCSQSNKRYKGQQAITMLLERTKANNTLLVRYDNASFKTDENGNVLSRVKDIASKMVKKRGGAV